MAKITATTTEKQRLIKPKDKVEAVYNRDSKYHKRGDKTTLHVVQFEKLSAKGLVVKAEDFNEDEVPATATGKQKEVALPTGKGKSNDIEI